MCICQCVLQTLAFFSCGTSSTKFLLKVANEESQENDSMETKQEEVEFKVARVSAKTVEVVKQTKLGLDVKKEENLAEWYSQVSFCR